MRQRSFIVVALALALLILGTVGVYAYDRTRHDVIADGVTAGGVDLSGMSPTEARATLQRQLARPLRKPVAVRYRHRRFVLAARRAKVAIDVDRIVSDALTASRQGNLLTRTTRALTGASVHATVPVAISYSKPAVKRFAGRVKRAIDRPARDATIDFSGGSLRKVGSRTGRKVDARALAREVAGEFVTAGSDHRVKPPLTVIKAKVTTHDLVRRYPRVIAIDRSGFRLTFYRHLRVSKTYRIAVGRQGLETPAGRYAVQDKQVNPSWHVPNSPWAGALAGRVIPPGPQDPIKARWMGIAGGAGIHGTDDIGSLGTAASHGCIRMSIPEVIELFDKIKVGDPVFIA